MKLSTNELVTREPFKSLFPVEPEVVKALTADMRANGFDAAQTIFVWKAPDGCRVVVDGHMRLLAAKAARLKEVHVTLRGFADEDEAFIFAIKVQRVRRNLTKLQIAEAIARAELAKQAPSTSPPVARSMGGSPKGKQGGGGSTKDPVRSSVIEKAAKKGVGTRTAERALGNVRGANGTQPKAKPSKTDTAQKAFDAWTKKHRQPLIPLVGDYEKLINKVGLTAARRGSELAFELALQAHREGKTTDEIFHTVTLEI